MGKNKFFYFNQLDLLDKKFRYLYFKNKFDIIIHLAAQPGVVYSIENLCLY